MASKLENYGLYYKITVLKRKGCQLLLIKIIKNEGRHKEVGFFFNFSSSKNIGEKMQVLTF
jgi:hypothetical protein